MIKRQEGKICFVVIEGICFIVSEFENRLFVSEFENNFCLIVSEFENNFWRENCREQYDFTKSLEIFP